MYLLSCLKKYFVEIYTKSLTFVFPRDIFPRRENLHFCLLDNIKNHFGGDRQEQYANDLFQLGTGNIGLHHL